MVDEMLLATNDAVSNYVGSYNVLNGFASSVAASHGPTGPNDPPQFAQARAVIASYQGWAMDWNNSLRAQCRSMPASVANWNPEMAALAAALESYATQPKTDPVDQSIATTASSVRRILRPDATLIKAMIGEFGALSGALAPLVAQMSAVIEPIRTLAQATSLEIAQLLATYRSVSNSHCPSAAQLQQIQEKIEQARGELSESNEWLTLLQGVDSGARSAQAACTYLGADWNGVLQEIKLILVVAAQIQASPAHLDDVEVGHLTSAWQQVSTEMAAIAGQLA